MKIYRHFVQQPFIAATGVAALAHSTWSLATLFTGEEPQQFTFAWFAWLAPALLIAFALDVGQIVTSSEIRAGQRKPVKYLTFAVFAIATYYLQWLYIAHHMPALALSSGVRESWGEVATLLRDAAIWIVPALLPLSTLLYTFSSDEHPVTKEESAPVAPMVAPVETLPEPTPAPQLPEPQPVDESEEVEEPRPTKARKSRARSGNTVQEMEDPAYIVTPPTNNGHTVNANGNGKY